MKNSLSPQVAKCARLFFLIYLQFGVTINTAKSSVQPTVQMTYLGLKLDAELKAFSVQPKIVLDTQAFLIEKFKLEDRGIQDIILTERFAKEGNSLLQKKFPDFDPTKIFINFRIIEQFMGRIIWANRNMTLDVEIPNLILLYRHHLSWKHPKIIKKAILEIFNLPKSLRQLQDNVQFIDPKITIMSLQASQMFENINKEK